MTDSGNCLVDMVAEVVGDGQSAASAQRLLDIARGVRAALVRHGVWARVSGDVGGEVPGIPSLRAVVTFRAGRYAGAPREPSVLHPLVPRDASRALAQAISARLRIATGRPWPPTWLWGALSVAKNEGGSVPAPAVSLYLGDIDQLDRIDTPALREAVVAGVLAGLAGMGGGSGTNASLATRVDNQGVAALPEAPAATAPEYASEEDDATAAGSTTADLVPSVPEAPAATAPEYASEEDDATAAGSTTADLIPSVPEAPAATVPEYASEEDATAASTTAATLVPSVPQSPAATAPEYAGEEDATAAGTTMDTGAPSVPEAMRPASGSFDGEEVQPATNTPGAHGLSHDRAPDGDGPTIPEVTTDDVWTVHPSAGSDFVVTTPLAPEAPVVIPSGDRVDAQYTAMDAASATSVGVGDEEAWTASLPTTTRTPSLPDPGLGPAEAPTGVAFAVENHTSTVATRVPPLPDSAVAHTVVTGDGNETASVTASPASSSADGAADNRLGVAMSRPEHPAVASLPAFHALSATHAIPTDTAMWTAPQTRDTTDNALPAVTPSAGDDAVTATRSTVGQEPVAPTPPTSPSMVWARDRSRIRTHTIIGAELSTPAVPDGPDAPPGGDTHTLEGDAKTILGPESTTSGG